MLNSNNSYRGVGYLPSGDGHGKVGDNPGPAAACGVTDGGAWSHSRGRQCAESRHPPPSVGKPSPPARCGTGRSRTDEVVGWSLPLTSEGGCAGFGEHVNQPADAIRRHRGRAAGRSDQRHLANPGDRHLQRPRPTGRVLARDVPVGPVVFRHAPAPIPSATTTYRSVRDSTT